MTFPCWRLVPMLLAVSASSVRLTRAWFRLPFLMSTHRPQTEFPSSSSSSSSSSGQRRLSCIPCAPVAVGALTCWKEALQTRPW